MALARSGQGTHRKQALPATYPVPPAPRQEPSVSGADAMIDRVVADIPNADSGFRLIFAATPFPGHQCQLDWIRADEDGGNWYRSTDLDMEGWLCPALFRYFDQALGG